MEKAWSYLHKVADARIILIEAVKDDLKHYQEGLVVEKNLNKAYEWFNRAAEQGHKEAISNREQCRAQINAR